MAITPVRLRFRNLANFEYEQTPATGGLIAGFDTSLEALSLTGKKVHAVTYDPSNAGGDLVKAWAVDNPVTELKYEAADALGLDGLSLACTKLYGTAINIRRLDASTTPTGTIALARTDWNGVSGTMTFSDAALISDFRSAGPYTFLTTSVMSLTASATGCGLVADVLVIIGTA